MERVKKENNLEREVHIRLGQRKKERLKITKEEEVGRREVVKV